MTRLSRAVRQQVKERALDRCEYCLLPEKFAAYSHQIDHIIPLLHGGNDALQNLALACFFCNNNKGTNIASYDPHTKALTPLFNPRQAQWSDHFVIAGAYINGKTAIGRVTIVILQMNTSKQVDTRRNLIEAKLW